MPKAKPDAPVSLLDEVQMAALCDSIARQAEAIASAGAGLRALSPVMAARLVVDLATVLATLERWRDDLSRGG